MTKIAYIGGTFDLFHAGHVKLLKRCYDLFDKVYVSLNTDDFAARFKRKPVMTLAERYDVLKACQYVSEVFVNEGDEHTDKTIEAIFGKLDPEDRRIYIVHGDDWTGEEYMKQLGITHDWLEAMNAEIVYLPYTPGISTSQIIERIKSL